MLTFHLIFIAQSQIRAVQHTLDITRCPMWKSETMEALMLLMLFKRQLIFSITSFFLIKHRQLEEGRFYVVPYFSSDSFLV